MNKIIVTALAVGMALASFATVATAKEAVNLGFEADAWVGTSVDSKKSNRFVDTTLRVNVDADVTKDFRVGGSVSAASDNKVFDLDVDDAYLYVGSNRFGRVVFGRSDNAAAALHLSAPNVGYGSNGTNLDSFTGVDSEMLNNTAWNRTSIRLFDDQRVKVSYYSPSLYGLRFGGTYSPSSLNRDETGNAVYGGAQFNQKFQGVGLGLSTGLGSLKDSDDRMLSYSVGTNVTVDRVTFGGSYAKVEREMAESIGWDIGVAYQVNKPAAVSLTYQSGRLVDEKRNAVVASGSYDFAESATGAVSVAHVTYTGKESSKTFVVLAGLRLRF